MMFGTVMMSNTNSTQSRNSQQSNNSNLLLLTTAPTVNSNNQNQQIGSISHLVSTKYSEVSDTETSERGYKYKSQRLNNWQKNVSSNQAFDQISISSQSTNIKQNSNYSTNNFRSIEPPLPSLPPPSVNEHLIYDKLNTEMNQKSETKYGILKKPSREANVENEMTCESNEKIQVQILPMDDNWGETNTTAHTADFSDFNDDMTEDGRSSHFNFNFNPSKNIEYMADEEIKISFVSKLILLFKKYFGLICAFSMSFCSFLTPILFILIPKLNLINQWQLNECGLECEGLLIGIAFKLFILLIGNWAIFLRRPKTTLPRIYELRAMLVFFLSIMTFSYWLFYIVRIIDTQIQDYYKILQFTVSYVDVLLFIFIISVFVLELRHLQPQFVVKIVRSPDGEQEEYNIGNMSIQRAAVWILEQYYKDFKVYNPWLENAHRKRAAQLMQIEQANKKRSMRGLESDDNNLCDNTDVESNKNFGRKSSKSLRSNSKYANASMVTVNLSANDRLYEEYEYERRLKKRKARLLQTTEEAFNHIKRIHNNIEMENDKNDSPKPMMDPYEAAQAVFTSIARDLRRYLRITRQQPYFTRDSIVAHLANCISYDMTPKSFLKRYIEGEPLLFNDRALSLNENRNKMIHSQQQSIESRGNNYNVNLTTMDQTWILISDLALYQSIEDNLMFVLKQNEVTLMCTFKRMPRFNLIEDILDPKRNKFILKLNSETTV